MAPSPENDSTPKAPDKGDKPRQEKQTAGDGGSGGGGGGKERGKTLSNLNDGELKDLLDEAITYRNPKDREGKSELFKDLLTKAEESERNARAARAGGSELVRHCNPSAKRNSRHRRKPSSISENLMHGGSLDNLAKEELFEITKHRTKKSVSARQREGGSLPCNVNSSITTHLDCQFLEEAKKKREMREKTYVSIDFESQSLLEHDCLAKDYQEQAVDVIQTAKYTTKATLQIGNAAVSVDDPIQISSFDHSIDRRNCDLDINPKVRTNCKLVLSNYSSNNNNNNNNNKIIDDEKKVDENDNAVQQNVGFGKKKKKGFDDKNVVCVNAELVEGHRSDIINDVDKLVEFIGVGSKNRSNKSKQLNKHSSDDSGTKINKKQRANSSKTKDNRSKLKKSNSLNEISTTNLDDFTFDNDNSCGSSKEKVVMRNNTNNNNNNINIHSGSNNNSNNYNKTVEKPRERRSWGNMEPIHQNLHNVSIENLETAEFRVVTKKKKSKKRRCSMNGKSLSNSCGKTTNRTTSPDLRRKSACSVPHSEKSNDSSSDVDSVHSLPIDTQHLADINTTYLNAEMPLSYADMARTNDKCIKKDKSNDYNNKVPNKEKINLSPSSTVTTIASISSSSSTTTATTITITTTTTTVVAVATTNTTTAPATTTTTTTPPQSDIIKDKTKVQSVVMCDKTTIVNNLMAGSNNCVKNIPPDVHNIKNFPAIQQNNNKNSFDKTNNTKNVNSSSNKVYNNNNMNNNHNNNNNNTIPNNKNIKNNVQKTVMCVVQNSHKNDIQTDLSIIQANEKEAIQFSVLPANIPDVQTIEKMHYQQYNHQIQSPISPLSPVIINTCPDTILARQTQPQYQHQQVPLAMNDNVNNNDNNNSSVDCDNSDRTNNMDDRPPVVILSGLGNNKEVPGLIFGFDVNEQLLSEDICEDFVARYVAPPIFTTSSQDHDKIVNFIGLAWEDALVNLSNGKVQYYTDL